MTFETENDTEVAAAYLTWRMHAGHEPRRGAEKSLDDLDGFFTFVVGTKNGFGVVRDPIACKPAVMAETDQYVAFGSEYRALADLPGIDNARGLGAGARNRLFLGALKPNADQLDLADARSLRELNQLLHTQTAGTNETQWEVAQPEGPARRRRRRRRAGQHRDQGQRRLLLRRHEQAGDDHRARLGRPRRRREHDVGRGRRQGRCQPVRRRHRHAAGCWSSRAMPRRAAASR